MQIKIDIAKPLAYIMNLMMQISVYPSRLKIAKIKLIFKGGDNNIIGNFRLISLLSWFNKIFETILNYRLTIFLNANNILTNCQFGFRKNSNTLLPLSELVNFMQNGIDNGYVDCAVFLDIAKAFDTLNHNILLNKLKNIGLPDNIVVLFHSYLSNRSQYIKDNNICSHTHSTSIQGVYKYIE